MKNKKIINEHIKRIARFKNNLCLKGDYTRLKQYANYLIKEIDNATTET